MNKSSWLFRAYVLALRLYYRILASILYCISPAKAKRWYSEIVFWRLVKLRKGFYFTKQYEWFYTTHFGFTREDFKGKTILDIGCGPMGTLEWAEGAKERIGLDPHSDMYEREFHVSKTQKMKYVNGVAETIRFPDGHFDFVYSFNSLDHVDNLLFAIAEIKRVVRPGGHFLLLCNVNHKPTMGEPSPFGWDIVKAFPPDFELVDERHYEPTQWSLYHSIQADVRYNHDDKTERVGIISAKFNKK